MGFVGRRFISIVLCGVSCFIGSRVCIWFFSTCTLFSAFFFILVSSLISCFIVLCLVVFGIFFRKFCVWGLGVTVIDFIVVFIVLVG